jgi:hypothetical protein
LNVANYLKREKNVKVKLESLASDEDGNLLGTVLVQNLAFEKRVSIRFTTDGWPTKSEVAANYMQPADPPPDPRTIECDRFAFSIKLGDIRDRIDLELCVRYALLGGKEGEWWDNNEAKNYHVQFESKVVVPTIPASHPTSHSPIIHPLPLPPNHVLTSNIKVTEFKAVIGAQPTVKLSKLQMQTLKGGGAEVIKHIDKQRQWDFCQTCPLEAADALAMLNEADPKLLATGGATMPTNVDRPL